VGYFLSYLILLTVSLTWLGYTLNINPLHLFPGVTGVIEAVIQWQLPQYKLLPYFFSTLFSAVCFFLTLFILVGLRDTKEEIG
jgi:hypothetical protein